MDRALVHITRGPGFDRQLSCLVVFRSAVGRSGMVSVAVGCNLSRDSVALSLVDSRGG